jgi:hypothetical protein
MPKLEPYIGDGGGGVADRDTDRFSRFDKFDIDLSPPRIERDDHLGLSLRESRRETDNLGLRLLEDPQANDRDLGIDLGPKLDVDRYEKYLGGADTFKDRAGPNDRNSPPASDSPWGATIFVSPLVPVNIPVYDPKGKKDYQVTLSLPKFKVGPDAAFNFGWGDSGRVFGGQIGFDFIPFGMGGVQGGASFNLDRPWESEISVQGRMLIITAQPIKINAGEIRQGVEDYLDEVVRKIHQMYGAPYP